MRMHADQVDVTVADARRLLPAELADRPVRPVASGGTVNAVFRVGDDLALRVPLRPFNGDLREVGAAARWPTTSSGCSKPCGGSPRRAGWRRRGRCGRTTSSTRRSTPPPTSSTPPPPAAWERLSAAGPWRRPPVWVHGDLLPGNLLLRDGRLVGLIDFAGAGVGDPACDLMVFWHVLGRSDRACVRRRLGLDDDTWHRGAAWALAQALVALPYYRHTNPHMTASARYAIRAVLGR